MNRKFYRKLWRFWVSHKSPSKVVRLLSILHVGRGDYLANREKLFAGETVTTLVEKIQAYQKERE